MKALTKYNRVAGYLEKIFNLLNEHYFNNEIKKPVITIQSTPRAYGHVTVNDAWTVDGESKKELNIGAGTLNRNIENVVATLLHEMVHLWNEQNGIQDTSRGYTYHNNKFKEKAEKCDLEIEKHEMYGWTITKPTDKLVELCILWDLCEIRITRIELFGLDFSGGFGNTAGKDKGTPSTDKQKKKSSTRKYQCPKCGISCRATKEINLICGDCETALIQV